MSALRFVAKSGRLIAPRIAQPLPSLRHLSTSLPRCKAAAADPFPLPLSDPELAKANAQLPADSEDWPMPQPLDRTGEDTQTLRARLVYQTRKRGTLETDLILSTFAKEALPSMTYDELVEFDKLLDEPDWDIFYWSVEKREPPPRWRDTAILARLKKHARNEGKVVRMMPELTQREPAL
ncbi:hypothetical protein IAT38_005045 [Cryptococcus sp. DSM 104549]